MNESNGGILWSIFQFMIIIIIMQKPGQDFAVPSPNNGGLIRSCKSVKLFSVSHYIHHHAWGRDKTLLFLVQIIEN